MLNILYYIRKNNKRPKVLLLVDKRNWAYDNSARHIVSQLKDDFCFDVKYVRDNPKLKPSKYDLIYVFFWGETYYQKFGFEKDRIIKEVSSHRWEDNELYGPCIPAQFVAKYLNDCQAVMCTSLRLFDKINALHPNVYHTPNGISIASFNIKQQRAGQLTIGWAGNVGDPVKGYHDVLKPACHDRFRLLTAPGKVSHSRMNAFYNQLDVFAICSKHEGEPLTLIESMAAGCFPVCTDVGIVPELVQHEVNGYIVSERSPQAFADAFQWCAANLRKVREAGEKNSRLIRKDRSWNICAPYFKRVFLDAYEKVSKPRFRNDDVSWDTTLVIFIKFCELFHRHGLVQVHGITLRGCTNTHYRLGDTPVEYEGYDTIANLDNDMIRTLSKGKYIEERSDLIQYLNSVPDQIALHGLYHTDYSRMSAEEQLAEMREGLSILGNIFPNKDIRYFIAPFNRTNAATHDVCRQLGLELLATDGVHLEAELSRLWLRPGVWYRYHHHRFYPESTFNYYKLSISLLDRALSKGVRT